MLYNPKKQTKIWHDLIIHTTPLVSTMIEYSLIEWPFTFRQMFPPVLIIGFYLIGVNVSMTFATDKAVYGILDWLNKPT